MLRLVRRLGGKGDKVKSEGLTLLVPKKKDPGQPGPWVAYTRLSNNSLTEVLLIVNHSPPSRAFSLRLLGAENEPMGAAGAGFEPTSLRWTDGGFTIKLPGIPTIYTVWGPVLFPEGGGGGC